MTQQKWEALSGLIISTIGLSIPVLLYFFPEKADIIDVMTTFVIGLLGVLGTFIAGWVTVNVIRSRAGERESVRYAESNLEYMRRLDEK